MKKNTLCFLLLCHVFLTHAQTIHVAAAANLRYVLEEIKTAYVKENPKTVVTLTFGSSGTLVQQILNGAPFDFFMAADNEFPAKIKAQGLGTGEISAYALGKLALYSTTLDVKKGLEILKDPSVKKVAIANPSTAPYGERSVALLKNQKMYESLQSGIVIGENISQAAQFAFTGNAEIGFVALSLVLAPDMQGKGSYYVIPPECYEPIEQSCILIKKPVLNPEASKFRTFVLSPVTRSLWEKYGYSVPSR